MRRNDNIKKEINVKSIRESQEGRKLIWFSKIREERQVKNIWKVDWFERIGKKTITKFCLLQ